MRRRIVFIAGVSAILVAVVITVAWFFLVHQTQRAIIQWADIQRENGVDVTWQSLEFTGFPLRIDAQIGDPQLIVRQPDRMARWKPSFLTFKFSSITPHAIEFVSPGAHDVQVTDGDTTWSAFVEAESLDGQAVFPPNDYQRIEQIAGRFAGVRVTPQAWTAPVTLERATLEATQHTAAPTDPQAVHPQGASLVINLAARGIGLPDDVLKSSALEPLGPLISAFSTEVEVKGALDAGSADVAALTAWRDDGGTVEFTSIELQWGSLRISAGGTLALDGNLQPVGSFATRIAGLEEFVTAMEAGGVLSSKDAAIVRITLAVLTRAPNNGGPAQAEIPITLQERILRLGPVALMEFPTIAWE